MANDKKEFMENYTGILRPDEAYRQMKEVEKAERLYGDATYNDRANEKLLEQAKERIARGGDA